ncbi:MAG: hypothetical protein RI601_11805, partial [Desulfurivibrionaceae bacterium]|nr:hypothetical protein [Desulfurivibrionaceae bacterium]
MKIFSRRNSILLVLAALAVLAVVGLRTFLAGPYLQQAIATYLAKEYDLQTTIGSYGGDLFRTFLFEDVLFTQGPPEDLQLSVAIRKLKVRYFLPALVRGLEPFLDTLVISVDGVVARLNIPPASGKESPEAPFELAQYLPASLPRLQIEDALIHVQAEDFAFSSAKTSLFIGAKEKGSQALQLTFPDLESTIARQSLPLSSLGLRLRYSPQSLVLTELEVNHIPVAGAARADFNTQANTIGISGRFDLEQGGIDLTAEGGASALALQLQVDKWPLPAKLIRLAAPSLPPVRG